MLSWVTNIEHNLQIKIFSNHRCLRFYNWVRQNNWRTFVIRAQTWNKTFNPFCSLRWMREKLIHPLFKDKILKSIGYSMTRVLDKNKSIYGSQQCLRFHNCFIMTLYQKMPKILFQKATPFLLKMWQFLHKMWLLFI